MKNLIARELFLSKKKIMISAVVFVIYTVLSLLILISFERGNLAKIEPVLRDSIKSQMLPIVELLPVMIGGTILISLSEATTRDELSSWRRFRRSTPVPMWKFSLSKNIVTASLALLIYGISLLYIVISCAVSGAPFTAAKAATAAFMVLALLVFAEAFMVLIMLFHSLDKAGIALMCVVIAVVAIIMFTNSEGSESNLDIFARIIDFCEKAFPFAPLIFVAITVLGWAGGTAVLQRREK